jgi:beta-aspartyl-peptidase (threonine type)
MPRLILHGGAGAWKKDNHDLVLAGMREAAAVGWEILHNGGTALEAVELATIALENNPLYDAGIGSYLNSAGEVEMDALITDGAAINFGATAGVKHVLNPITLARLILTNSDHNFVIAQGADQLAREMGLEPVSNMTFVTEEEFALYKKRLENPAPTYPGHGTVGAVALDQNGNISSATSTGGTSHKKKGRVGDVPIFGAGGYADNHYGGASATGVGENIMRHLLCKCVVDNMAHGDPANSAAVNGVTQVENHIPNSQVGVIVIGADGSVGAAHTTAFMPISWVDSSGAIHASMKMPYAFD